MRRRRALTASERLPDAIKRPGHHRATREPARCGVCRVELGPDAFHLDRAGHEVGSFCSAGCLAAVEALAALQSWAARLEARGAVEEAEARDALADELLILWRRGTGPDPAVVSRAVELARGREPRFGEPAGARGSSGY
jgi:hypothetical protein